MSMTLLLITFASSLIAMVFSDLTTCDLCNCYNLQPAGVPITFNNQICYTYLIHTGSDEFYCDPISSLIIGTNQHECGLNIEHMFDIFVDYTPKCYDIDIYHQQGIKLMHTVETEYEGEDYGVFSLCFNADQVAGFNEDGQIRYTTTTGISFTCDSPYLPNFCGTDSCLPITASPTTPQPTTSSPTTSLPTTDNPTTEEPTKSPTFTVCDSTDPYNIAFLLDESGSVSREEWDIIIDFVQRIIDFDVQDDSYVALYEFASLPGFQNFLNFTGPKSAEQGEILNALESMRNRYTKAGQTETWDAVNRVLDDYYQVTTNPDHPAVGNILFLVTDGNPTDEAGDITQKRTFVSDQYNTCPYIENRLRTQFPDNYIDVVLIIIDPDAKVDTSKVECLDYYNNQTDIIPIATFDSTAFHQIEERIRSKICTDGGNGGDQSGPGTDPWVYPDGDIGLGPVPIADDGGVACSNDPGSANPCDPATSKRNGTPLL